MFVFTLNPLDNFDIVVGDRSASLCSAPLFISLSINNFHSLLYVSPKRYLPFHLSCFCNRSVVLERTFVRQFHMHFYLPPPFLWSFSTCSSYLCFSPELRIFV